MGKSVVARDQGESLLDRSPDEQAVKRITMFWKPWQAAGTGRDFLGKRKDVPTGLDDEAGEILRGGTLQGEFTKAGLEADFPEGDDAYGEIVLWGLQSFPCGSGKAADVLQSPD